MKIFVLLPLTISILFGSPKVQANNILHDDNTIAKALYDKNFEDYSFEELKKESLEKAETLSFILTFLLEKDEPHYYDPEEEEETEPIRLNPAYLSHYFKDGIKINQEISNQHAAILRIYNNVKERPGEKIIPKINKIYYSNGTTETFQDQAFKYITDCKKIDSINISIYYRYPEDIETFELSKKKNKIKYADSEIILRKIDKNEVLYNLPDSLEQYLIKTQALTKAEHIVDIKSKMTGFETPEKQYEWYKKINSILDQIANKIKQNKYTSKTELISDIYQLNNIKDYPKDAAYFIQEQFRGNVEKIILYFTTKYKIENFDLTYLVDSELSTINTFLNQEENIWYVIEEDGKIVIEIPNNNYQKINDFYLINDSTRQVWNINIPKQRLDAIKNLTFEYSFALTDSLLVLANKDKRGLLDEKGKVILPMIYDFIEIDKNHTTITADQNDSYSLFNTKGKIICKRNGKITSFSEGIAMVKDNKKDYYSILINTKGEKVGTIPPNESVEKFSDGLALISINEKYGFIDKKGNIAIPPIYDYAEPFEDGITMITITIENDKQIGLIDKNQNYVVSLQPYKNSNISTNPYFAKNPKRIYTINGLKYSHKGELIKD